MPETVEQIRNARRVVVKVGSAVLAAKGGGFHRPTMAEIARMIAAVRDDGHEVVLVSSGAILAGSRVVSLNGPPNSIGEKQALAAVGQVDLMNAWREIFRWHGIDVAQILLTRDDLAHRRRFLNARRTMGHLLSRDILPVVNENDTVMVAEIKLGDNDHLSSLITNLVSADLLVILTEVEGVFTADPRTHPDATLIPRIGEFSPELLEAAGEPGPSGRGGMATKVEAARKASLFGVPTVIACGREPRILQRIIAGEAVGTTVVPNRERMDARKHWIAFSQPPTGRIRVDAGAAAALSDGGKSLLPSGIVGLAGPFDMGDLVEIVGPDGEVIGRGITSYQSSEVEAIKGHRSSDIETILGYKTADEVVHRDHMVVGEDTWRDVEDG